MHEIAGLGELRSPWHDCQMTWLQNHLDIINAYSQALENIDNQKSKTLIPFALCNKTLFCRIFLCAVGRDLRKSVQKGERSFEFVPTNLVLQRMWADNESLRKTGCFDTFTHGAFTQFGLKSPGLIK